jgi:hypothetical protein
MKYLVITIDVEPDCSLSWRYSDPLTFDGVSVGIVERLQPLFNRFDVVPTYLINNVVLEDRRSVEAFRSLTGRFELGSHLHGEFIEPQKKFSDYAGKKGEANQCALPADVEYAKMENLTRLFERCFDRKPTAFRAGRFSAGPNTIRCLEQLGYKVDTSVTPHVIWSDKAREVPLDFMSAPEQPYFVAPGTLLDAGPAGAVLEVPVSIMDRRILFRDRPIWLRPVFSGYREMRRLLHVFGGRYASRPVTVFNMMFHNVEVLPGKSPYTRTERDCEQYLNVIERILTYCRENGIVSVGLSALHEIFRGAAPEPAKREAPAGGRSTHPSGE